jgi:hypothetical protein
MAIGRASGARGAHAVARQIWLATAMARKAFAGYGGEHLRRLDQNGSGSARSCSGCAPCQISQGSTV